MTNGIVVLNTTTEALEDKISALDRRYKEILKQEERFHALYPTLRNWYNETWIRLNNPTFDADRIRAFTARGGSVHAGHHYIRRVHRGIDRGDGLECEVAGL
ncbi:MAG: hypothetical protein HC902_14160 [Calothrix sp. SM1_5_4]|nr:hypothetical protein [Calothrix sp. SM1_5_4]